MLMASLCRLVHALMWISITVNPFDSLRIFGAASYLQITEADQLQAMANAYFSARFDQYYIGLLFGALASTLCGHLSVKSRYIPRLLATGKLVSSTLRRAFGCCSKN